MTCDTPPSACFEPQGTCVEGSCEYDPLPDGSPCDDGNPCTEQDRCESGTCTGTSITCDPPPDCHGPGTCNPDTGSCDYPPLADGTPCRDGRCREGRCVPTGPGPDAGGEADAQHSQEPAGVQGGCGCRGPATPAPPLWSLLLLGLLPWLGAFRSRMPRR